MGETGAKDEMVAWTRGHIKDVINQCLTETQKLHVGAHLDDKMGNGAMIAGCGKKAYLIVDKALHPDAKTLEEAGGGGVISGAG
mmetsp:Transcript_15465/g.27406  ORF Transcript_15465/g.27406 Transcript_15465/m.27406 type:complete len:84 (-) Transcript_15465:106-357(-)